MERIIVRVLILGANGMLGHKLFQLLGTQYDVWGTVRSGPENYRQYGIFDTSRLISGVDALDIDSVMRAFAHVHPDYVINCIGIVKQLKEAKDPYLSINVNALFPHRLARLCQACNSRLVHISTDCVFSGRRGFYTEVDVADADDIYGRTKFLGEVGSSGCLTLRTSIIGRELASTRGLVEWFLSQRGGKIKGYSRAIFSGFTTLSLARIVGQIIDKHQLSGVYQVSSEPIDKYTLLCLLRDAYSVSVDIEPYPDVQIDRSLDSARFRTLLGFTPPSWPEMVSEMAADPTPYDCWQHPTMNKAQ
jgi:dTDP-4-dehydrorhamnose reductase